jgi:hypothetical protein
VVLLPSIMPPLDELPGPSESLAVESAGIVVAGPSLLPVPSADATVAEPPVVDSGDVPVVPSLVVPGSLLTPVSATSDGAGVHPASRARAKHHLDRSRAGTGSTLTHSAAQRAAGRARPVGA